MRQKTARRSGFTEADVKAAYETCFVFGIGNPLPVESFFLDLSPDDAVARLVMIARAEDARGFPNYEHGTWEKTIYADIEKARKK